ncbi:MAG: peptidoglycan-binding protein [Candidatus Nanopelagicales bacterium]|jgi:peptidoglycan hydrolase-like protein with peptidoglycan-binding domain|nr:peptidoglycan-binding protein [Candidatus Nanopelagicales bacterium]
MTAPSRLRRRAGAALLGTCLVLSAPAGAAWATDPADPAATGSTGSATATAPGATAPATDEPRTLGSRVLRRGDTGRDVVALQKLLRVKRTGTFNKATKRAVQQVQRKAGIRAHGVVGPVTLKAIRKADRALKARASSRSLPRAGSPAASQRYAAAYIAQRYGWGAGQMSCLRALWTRESGWRYWVSNPNGIYRGIPQTSARVWGAMGYTTAQYMRSPEIQIKVGAQYIRGRYGTPCNAWAFWRSHHWY